MYFIMFETRYLTTDIFVQSSSISSAKSKKNSVSVNCFSILLKISVFCYSFNSGHERYVDIDWDLLIHSSTRTGYPYMKENASMAPGNKDIINRIIITHTRLWIVLRWYCSDKIHALPCCYRLTRAMSILIKIY